MATFFSCQTWGDFPAIFTVRIWWDSWRWNSWNVETTPPMLPSPQLLPLILICIEPPAIHQLQFKVFLPMLAPTWASRPLSCDFLSLPVCLSNFGAVVCLVASILWWARKSCWFLVCSALFFSFSFVMTGIMACKLLKYQSRNQKFSLNSYKFTEKKCEVRSVSFPYC